MSRFTERSYYIAGVVLTVLGCYFGYQTVVDILRIGYEAEAITKDEFLSNTMMGTLLVKIALLLLTGGAALWSLRKGGDAADYRRWLEKQYDDER
ncbi:hypothetical protein [Serratia marcescens]|uniref:hypothetical protein n=1 Tax=Serratia marcescens TaxID=615 RepID=UPI00320484B4